MNGWSFRKIHSLAAFICGRAAGPELVDRLRADVCTALVVLHLRRRESMRACFFRRFFRLRPYRSAPSPGCSRAVVGFLTRIAEFHGEARRCRDCPGIRPREQRGLHPEKGWDGAAEGFPSSPRPGTGAPQVRPRLPGPLRPDSCRWRNAHPLGPVTQSFMPALADLPAVRFRSRGIAERDRRHGAGRLKPRDHRREACGRGGGILIRGTVRSGASRSRRSRPALPRAFRRMDSSEGDAPCI